MILKLKDVKLRITKNENNHFWKPIGKFWNKTQIKIKGEWYNCTLRFIKIEKKYYIQFHHPMKVEKKTNLINVIICEGLYKEVETSFFKYNLVQYLENTHYLNSISYDVRKSIFERSRMLLIFSLALIPSFLFYLINVNYDNIIIDKIAENTWVQTFFFFLSISSFISIFHPFSIRKQIEKDDIKEIVKENIEEEKQNEDIKHSASF
jgi:hypothetical protein